MTRRPWRLHAARALFHSVIYLPCHPSKNPPPHRQKSLPYLSVLTHCFCRRPIKTLLAGATDRDKLYLLLMMNCGFTQVDIANLKQDEVDFKAGTITRKRSKTQDYDKVPTVRYPLWKTTLALLKVFHDQKGDLVLRGYPKSFLDIFGVLCGDLVMKRGSAHWRQSSEH